MVALPGPTGAARSSRASPSSFTCPYPAATLPPCAGETVAAETRSPRPCSQIALRGRFSAISIVAAPWNASFDGSISRASAHRTGRTSGGSCNTGGTSPSGGSGTLAVSRAGPGGAIPGAAQASATAASTRLTGKAGRIRHLRLEVMRVPHRVPDGEAPWKGRRSEYVAVAGWLRPHSAPTASTFPSHLWSSFVEHEPVHSQLAYRFGELYKVHRLSDVAIGSTGVAADKVLLLLGGSQDDDG